MKKTGFLMALLLVFVLVGCQKQKEQNGADAIRKQEQAESGSKFNMYKMRQAMKKGKQVKCIDNSMEEVKNVIYVKGDKYRLESNFGAGDQSFRTNVVSDGKTVYSWNDKAKQSGTKFDLACMEEMQKEIGGETDDQMAGQMNFKDSDEVIEEIDEKEDQMECVLDNSQVEFTPPGDVKFTDQCEQFKQMMKNMEQMKNSVK